MFSFVVLLALVALSLVDGAANLLVQKRVVPTVTLITPSTVPNHELTRNRFRVDDGSGVQRGDLKHEIFSTGKNFTVEIHVFNVGDASAYDVAVTDPWASSAFQLASGSTRAAFEEIAAGGSQHYNFTLVPLTEGTHAGFPATVTYQTVENGPTQTGTSNPMRSLNVLAADIYDKITAKHTREWFIFSVLAFGLVFGPLAAMFKLQSDFPGGVPTQPKPSQ
jgi:hypothetical protein